MAKSQTQIMNTIRSNVLTGVFVLAPLYVVLLVILWFWNLLYSFTSLIPSSLHPQNIFNITDPFKLSILQFFLNAVSLVLIILFLAWVGFLSRRYIGKKLLTILRAAVTKVPVLSSIYSTIEQLTETFSGDTSKNFRRVVKIEFPRKGVHTLALVTSERGDGLITVYVPTTPNPTGGYYLMVSEKEVEELDMSVEDALKEIISMGLVHKD